MKRKILAFAFITICLSVLAYSTTAYFTYEDTATNVITMGNVKIELQELSVPEGGETAVPFTDPIDVLPGTDVSKIVQVKNVGAEPAWIRISVGKSILLAQGVTGEADPTLVSYDVDPDAWIEKDGYYYYKVALQPGETTQPLFTEVSFSPDMGDMYQQSKAIVHVLAQATQTKNNGSGVLDAAGWPEKQ